LSYFAIPHQSLGRSGAERPPPIPSFYLNLQGGGSTGNKSQGSITIVRPDGKTERVQYQVTGEEGVILFNGIKFAYAGAPECQ